MKWPSTIVVLVLATIGVIAMLRAGWSESDRGGAANRTERLVTSAQLPLDELTRITLTRTGEQPLVFEREGTQWKQVQPFAYPMDAFSIRQLGQIARELDVLDTIDARDLAGGLSAESLALKPAIAELHYEWAGGSTTLHLGRRSVAGRAYVQIKGDENIYIVNQKLHERAVDMDPKEWRNRTIFADAGVESSRIEWNYGALRMALVRERKQWSMVEPVRTRIEPEVRDQYLDAIGRATVSGFILDQPSDAELVKFQLVDSPISLTITGGQDSAHAQRLIIGGRAGGGTQDFFGMIEGRPAVVRISGAVIARLFMQPQALAAHTASGIVPADVKSIAIRTSSEELLLERDLEKWRANGERDVNPAHVQELLDQLTQLRASSVELVEYPRDLEVATITLGGYDGRAIDTVRVVHDPQTGNWGMENGDNVLRIYPASVKVRLTVADFGLQ